MVKKSFKTEKILCETFSYGNCCNNKYFLYYWDRVYDGEGDMNEYKRKLADAEHFALCIVKYFIQSYFKTKLQEEYVLNETKTGVKWNKLFLDEKLPTELLSAIRTFHYFSNNLTLNQHLRMEEFLKIEKTK